MALDASVGGASANSYATVDEAATYHAARLYADTWTGAQADDQAKALQMATKLLDAQVDWLGIAASTTQALGWPRFGVMARNGWFHILPTIIPTELKDATAEFARQLLDGDRTADSETETEGIKSLKVSTIAIDFDRPQAKVIPDAVFYLIRHLGRVSQRSGSGSLPLVRA